MNKVDDLKWIRIFTPSHIPTYLIEQVRDRDYSVEDFYKYHEVNCLLPSKDGEVRLNPFSHLYVLANEVNEVKGMLWFGIDPLSKDIIIQTFSMDKDYWNKGIAVKKLSNHIKKIRRKANLNKIYWVTNYPKHSERNGFTRSKNVLMEYNEENEVNHGENRHRMEHGNKRKNVGRESVIQAIMGGTGEIRRHQPIDTTAEQLSEQCAGTTAAESC